MAKSLAYNDQLHLCCNFVTNIIKVISKQEQKKTQHFLSKKKEKEIGLQ